MEPDIMQHLEERFREDIRELKLDFKEMRATLQTLIGKLDERNEKLEARLRIVESRQAWMTGALGTLSLIWPFILKKAGVI